MDKEQKAFERLRLGAEMSKQYYDALLIICYSGGKDSDVLVQLAINSGIDFEVLHNHTTADAPETVQHIRDTFKRLELQGINCTVEYPVYKGKRTSMWELIPQKLMPPTRLMRYCCSILKEKGGQNRAIATGVRWAESRARSKRGIYEDINRNNDKKIILNNDNDDKRLLFERCEKQAKTVVNPIIDWQETDIWDYIKDNDTPCNPLYCELSRIGCIGCPLSSKKNRYAEFRAYPRYEQMYIHAFERMLDVRQQRGRTDNMTWQSGYDVFRWWMEEDFTQYEFTDKDFEEN
ncbi:adenylyl-sulfate reductase [Lachnospiraceae bacterium MD329]|nr:adenylyl-sulfate reductase [Lachnospiraceae bacterium MD329]